MKAFVFKNNSNILKKSSSGGAFLAITKSIYDNYHETVNTFGAEWEYGEKIKVKHSYVSTFENCEAFCGSKYVQSDIGGAFEQVKNKLLYGEVVNFSGTPCQVIALKRYLKRYSVDCEKLYTVELICNGVPKSKAFELYIDWIEKYYKSKVVKISFRDKNQAWKGYPISIEFSNGKRIRNTYASRMYLKLYFLNLITAKRCFCCPAKDSYNRPSDFTIGDFWGIETLDKSIDTSLGVSMILVNTKKGELIMKKILDSSFNDDTKIYECKVEDCLVRQRNLSTQLKKPKEYDEFNKDLEKFGFEYVIKKYRIFTPINRIRYYFGNIKRKFIR